MPAISLNDVASLPDVLPAFRYELLITPPNAGQTGMRALSLRCQNVMFPGSNIEFMPIGLNGFTINYRGRKLFMSQLSATFVETSDCIVWSTLKNWQESIVGTYTGNGHPKVDYVSTSTVLNVYDEQGEEAAMFAQIFNLWPLNVPDVNLEGQASMPFQVTAQFMYDWATYSNVPTAQPTT